MDPPAKKAKSENILFRLCDKFTRTEVSVICPVIKAENSVRVLSKLQEEKLVGVLRRAGKRYELDLKKVIRQRSAGNKEIEGVLFCEYSASNGINEDGIRRLREALELELENVLKGKYTLIDKVDDTNQMVPQPVISGYDFELHKLRLFYQKLHNPEIQNDFCTVAEIIELMLGEVNESYTTFAVLSQNGKGKSFILNLLLLMMADSRGEYLCNNKDMQLPKGFPNCVQWETILESNLPSLPDVVKDFIKNKTDNTPPPLCYQLTYDQDINESLNSFSNIDKYFLERRMLELEPYVLAQKQATGACESTTKCILRLRYGTCYQMKVEYFEAKELQQQLYELFTTETDSSQVIEKVKEKAEECLKARYKILTGHEFTQKERVMSYEDIILSEEVLEIAGKTELYIGGGRDCIRDRLALQDVLKALTTAQEEDMDMVEETKRKIAAVKEILVYIPSKILHGGKEILEMPGTDDSDPIAMFSVRNALSEADAVILVTDYGLKLCEKEVKDMLSDSGFLQRFKEDPISNKLMLIAYPEKDLKWHFSREGKNNIRILEKESKKKKDRDLKALAKMIEQESPDHEESIFTTYLLPVLHSSILSQKDPNLEHEVIATNSDFLKYTGVIDLFIQLDEFVLSRQKSCFDQANTQLEHFEAGIKPMMTAETARLIEQRLGRREFQSLLRELNQNLENDLDRLKGDLMDQVEQMVETALKEYIPIAKQQWNAEKHKIVSIAAYNPNFIGKNPKFKGRPFNIIFGRFQEKREIVFEMILQRIEKVFEEFKNNMIHFYTTNLNDFLNPVHVPLNFVKQTILNKLNDAQRRYMGNIKRPLNKKTLEKLMDESQKASMKSVILEDNYKQSSLETAIERTGNSIEECMMNVKDLFMGKLLNLHDQRFKCLRSLLLAQRGGSKIWKDLELKIKRVSRNKGEDTLEQFIQSMKNIISANLKEFN